MSKTRTTHAEYCTILYLNGYSIRQIRKTLSDKRIRGVEVSFEVIHKWISGYINIPDFSDTSAFLDGVNAWDNYHRDLDELLGNKETTDGFKKARAAFTEDNFQVGLKLMELIRDKLIESDIKLEDCTNVLVDYQQAISQLNYKKYSQKEEEAPANDEEQ